MQNAETVTFAQSSLDRAAHLREDDTALSRLRADPAARALPLWRGKPLVTQDAALHLAWLPLDAPVLDEAVEAPIFLGLEDGAPRFAYDISAWDDPAADPVQLGRFLDQSANAHPSLPESQRFLDLRGIMAALPPEEAGNAATAKGIFAWHDTHRFCARCGAPSETSMAGWQRRCIDCGAFHFPRTDPVVIMLILHGNDVLLGRSPGWPEGMYSLLAGFMEPGESIEAAVRREVMEESAVEVGPVRYLSSQPWPFPSSLMIGCVGEAVSRDIRPDPNEIEDALWVGREEILASFHEETPRIRPARKGSIAHFLITRWLQDRLD